jgi:hypothetical protein
MSGWNRLTNAQRAELAELPVWTTEEDRRRALSYADRHLAEAREAIAAVRAGQKAPPNLGEIVAVARYEDAGWMPDGCFEQWRRWTSQGAEQMDVGVLVQWLGFVEGDLQGRLSDLESKLTIQCQAQDERLAAARNEARRAHRQLHEHHRTLILARLSVGDTTGAREIALRVPAGPARDEVDTLIQEAAATDEVPAVRDAYPTRRSLPDSIAPKRQ